MTQQTKDWPGQPSGQDLVGYFRILTNKTGDEECHNCRKELKTGEKFYVSHEELEFDTEEGINVETDRWCKTCFKKYRVIQDL